MGDYPIKLEMVPKRLIVSVYQQSMVGKGSQIPCWVYVTQGMSAFKQKEFVLVLRVSKDGNARSFPKSPLQLMLFLFKSVAQKKFFHVGDVLKLGDKGVLGFAGMGFSYELVTAPDVVLPKHYLTCILLSKEETMAAQLFGLTRVLSRISYESNRFPVHAWNDLERASMPMQSTMNSSTFRNINILALKYSSVNLVAGEKVVLIVAPVIHATISNFIKQYGGAAHLGFITQLLPYHEGSLVWLPEKDSIEMNVQPDAEGHTIAGSNLRVSKADQMSVAMVEDGFVLQLDAQTWPQLLTALLRKQNLLIPSFRGEMEFSLLWNPSPNPESHSGLDTPGAGSANQAAVSPERRGWLGKLKGVFGHKS